MLEVYNDKKEIIATGSGFVSFDDGTLITNEHVIDDAAYIIAYSDQYKASHMLTNLKTVDKQKDIAILEFETKANVTPLKYSIDNTLLRGQPVIAIGSPKGIINTVSSGNISNIVYYSNEIPDCIQFTAPISPGSSGGALFDEHGNVIGLCVSALKEGDAMYYAIPIKYVKDLFDNAIDNELIPLAQYNKLDSHYPVYINSITIQKDSISLEWTKKENIKAYEIYRRSTVETEFSLIASVQTTKFLDKNIQKGEMYDYYIKTLYEWGSSLPSRTVSIKTGEATPTPRPKPTSTPTPRPKPTPTPKPITFLSIVHTQYPQLPSIPVPKPTAEPSVMLQIPDNSYGQWEFVSGDRLKLRIQVKNASSTRTIVAYELYYYPVDVWGERLIPEDKIYSHTVEKTIKPGETQYSDYVNISNAKKINRVYVAVNKVKYSDGTIRNVLTHNYIYWDID